MLEHTLRIPRGAKFDAIGWVLKRSGQPIRTPAGLEVVAKIRRTAGDEHVLHVLDAEVVMMSLPQTYGPDPVAVGLLQAMTATATSALPFDRGVWDMMINHEPPMVGGLVTAPWVVSR
jgi:hypothetical protein